MAEHAFETWDVFTDRPFAGNPLAVVTEAEGLDAAAMQAIAKEFNLAETAFVLPPADPAHAAQVRIFTPSYEMPFAGHPTVGTAIALASARGLSGGLVLELKAGLFPVRLENRGGALFAAFENPNPPAERGPAPAPALLAAALSLDEREIDAGAHRPRRVGAGVDFFYARAPLDAVRRARLDSAAWRALDMAGTVGVLLYAEGGDAPEADYHVRMFAPDAGVFEDPATGSAACALPGQVALAGALGDGDHRWVVEQGAELGRPSRIDVAFTVEKGVLSPVRIGGTAVPMTKGRLYL